MIQRTPPSPPQFLGRRGRGERGEGRGERGEGRGERGEGRGERGEGRGGLNDNKFIELFGLHHFFAISKIILTKKN